MQEAKNKSQGTLESIRASETGREDLRPTQRWEPAAPDGWAPVARVCQTVRDALEELTQTIVDAIRREIDDYARTPSVSTGDLFASVYQNVDVMLLGIAEHRGPHGPELEVRRQLGRYRARQGLPIQSLVAAYHVGYRELWAALVREARAAGDPTPDLLLEGSAIVWGWIHSITAAVTDEYLREVAQRQAADSRARSHFIDLLMHDAASEECAELARGYGFRPEGTFQALAVPLTGGEEAQITDSIRGRRATAIVGDRGRTAIILVQSGRPESGSPQLALGVNQLAGVGLPRVGIANVRLSIVDAERALELSRRRGRPSRFEEDWLEATLLSHQETLAPVLKRSIDVARLYPHLAETVRTFAAVDLSLAEAARQLHLAPNSVRHRLDRWTQLSGVSPWTLIGASRSLIALELCGSESWS